MKKIILSIVALALILGSFPTAMVRGQEVAQEESSAENGIELPQEATDLEDNFDVQDELDFENDFSSCQDEVNIDPQAVEYRFRRSWGGEGDQLISPKDIAVDKDNNLIVADWGSNRIVIINQNDRSVRSFGGRGSEPGKFDGLEDLTLASDGTIFAVDKYNQRVQRFLLDGRLIKTWGSSGSEPGQFNNPSSIAVSKDEFIYVVDNDNTRVQKFTYDGEYLLSWGEEGSRDGQFNTISDIAVDNSGFVYVTDYFNHRIQKFDRNGNYDLKWDIFFPVQITVNKQGNLLVSDYWSEKINLFSPEGELLALIIPADMNSGFTHGLAVDSSGAIYASSSSYHEINKYSSDGALLNKWGNRDTPAGKFYTPAAAVFTSTGNLLVVEQHNYRVQELSPYGSPVMKFGQEGEEEGNFLHPSDIARDKAGNIYVADYSNERIQIFNQNGTMVRAFDIVKEEGGWAYPSSIALDSRGDIYVLDNMRCQRYTNDGLFKMSWEVGYNALSIYIDIEDNLYVLFENDIKQYNLEGTYLNLSIGKDQLSSPQGMFITPNGNNYIADTGHNRILILDSNGNYLNSFGSFGSLPGELYRPEDVLVAENGDVYVVDSGNQRIQVFSPQVIQPDSYSGLVQNGGFEKSPALMEWTTGGDLTVSRTANSYQGNHGMRLGKPVGQTEQGQGEGWAYTNFYVDPNWSRPVLKFKYKMSVNDILDYSDFFVAVQDGVGLNHLETVLRDGYKPCNPGEAPAPGRDLGWRSVSFDLSKYKGQHIRVNFSNRNLWPDSLGIWTDIDDVMVWDEGPLPYVGPYRTDLPMLFNRNCDLRAKGTAADENIIMRDPISVFN